MFIFDEKILNQIQKLTDDDIEKYILARINWLEERINEDRKIIEADSMNKSTVAHGFISKTTEIYAESGIGSTAIGGFLVNDKEIYRILIKNIKNQNSLDSLNDILQIIQRSIDEYFGRTS